MNAIHRRQLVIGTLCAVAFVVVAIVWWSGNFNNGRSDDVCDALELTDTADGRVEMQAALEEIEEAAFEADDVEVLDAVERIWALDAAGEDTTIGFLDLGLADDDC